MVGVMYVTGDVAGPWAALTLGVGWRILFPWALHLPSGFCSLDEASFFANTQAAL